MAGGLHGWTKSSQKNSTWRLRKPQKETCKSWKQGGVTYNKWHCPNAGTRVVKQKSTWNWISQVKYKKKKLLQEHMEQKEAQREFQFAFEWGWGPGDEEHQERWSTLCLLHLCLLIRLPFMNLRAPRAGEIPKHRRFTFSGGGSGLGTFKQTHVHRSWWDEPVSAEVSGQGHCKDTSHFLWRVAAVLEGSWGLLESKCHSLSKNSKEENPNTSKGKKKNRQ